MDTKRSHQKRGGASLAIEGGNITVQCPGTITVHASMKSFSGPDRENYPLPVFPDATTSPRKSTLRFALAALPGPMWTERARSNYAGEPYRLYADGVLFMEGLADEGGSAMWEHKAGTKKYTVELLTGQKWEIDVLEHLETEGQRLANRGYRGYESEAARPAENTPDSDAFRRRASGGKGGE